MTDYLDTEVMCNAVGHNITLRCTKKGIIICKYPWQKCMARKNNADRDHCVMTRMIEDVPRQVERMRKSRDSILSTLLLWLGRRA